jgi:uncharacterized protein YegP (UPF0339 family)
MSKFVVKTVPTGFLFHLKAGNGEIIGVSEVYTSKPACLKGIDSVKSNAAAAGLEDQTVGEQVKNPKFEVYADKKGEFRFRLKAKNGEIILSSEGYKAKPSCLNGVESVRRNAPDAAIEEAEA